MIGHLSKTEYAGAFTAFTKWCPPENRIKSFENAQKAIDLALSRMGQGQIALMQCESRFDTCSEQTMR
jgi:hypothetical protein